MAHNFKEIANVELTEADFTGNEATLFTSAENKTNIVKEAYFEKSGSAPAKFKLTVGGDNAADVTPRMEGHQIVPESVAMTVKAVPAVFPEFDRSIELLTRWDDSPAAFATYNINAMENAELGHFVIATDDEAAITAQQIDLAPASASPFSNGGRIQVAQSADGTCSFHSYNSGSSWWLYANDSSVNSSWTAVVNNTDQPVWITDRYVFYATNTQELWYVDLQANTVTFARYPGQGVTDDFNSAPGSTNSILLASSGADPVIAYQHDNAGVMEIWVPGRNVSGTIQAYATGVSSTNNPTTNYGCFDIKDSTNASEYFMVLQASTNTYDWYTIGNAATADVSTPTFTHEGNINIETELDNVVGAGSWTIQKMIAIPDLFPYVYVFASATSSTRYVLCRLNVPTGELELLRAFSTNQSNWSGDSDVFAVMQGMTVKSISSGSASGTSKGTTLKARLVGVESDEA